MITHKHKIILSAKPGSFRRATDDADHVVRFFDRLFDRIGKNPARVPRAVYVGRMQNDQIGRISFNNFRRTVRNKIVASRMYSRAQHFLFVHFHDIERFLIAAFFLHRLGYGNIRRASGPFVDQIIDVAMVARNGPKNACGSQSRTLRRRKKIGNFDKLALQNPIVFAGHERFEIAQYARFAGSASRNHRSMRRIRYGRINGKHAFCTRPAHYISPVIG